MDFVKKRGPSTPIEVAIGTGLNSLFVSAIISDAETSKQLQRSCTRIGSSHLYFTPEQRQKARLKIYNLLEDGQKEILKEIESKKVFLEGDIDEQHLVDYGDFLTGFTLGEQNAWYWFDLDGEKALKILESRVKPKPQVQAEVKKPVVPARKPAVSQRGSVKKKPTKRLRRKSQKTRSKSKKKRAMASL